ncbi:MAG TPA: HAD family hydrolase [Candidatus Methylomirabilis sp.]|nr:HAD family hydrolase [Candidatus Methylomirabilis sp.]
MIRGVLFDLDGTLVDTWDLYVEAYTRTLAPHVGRRLTLDELIALRPISELRLLRGALGPGEAVTAQRDFLGHYRCLHPTRFGGVYPGVRQMLTSLRDLGFRLGIVTGKSRGAWEITAEAADLGEFDVLVTDEEVARAKPDAEGLSLALTRLESPAEAIVYVGDSVVDAQAARAAGVRFVAALWPKAEAEVVHFLTQVRQVGTWAELTSPAGLVDLLEGGQE